MKAISLLIDVAFLICGYYVFIAGLAHEPDPNWQQSTCGILMILLIHYEHNSNKKDKE